MIIRVAPSTSNPDTKTRFSLDRVPDTSETSPGLTPSRAAMVSTVAELALPFSGGSLTAIFRR